MNDDINNEAGVDGADDQGPMSGGFLSQDEIEQRVAVFRASLFKLDQDPAESARIDGLIAGANAMFGDDLTPFEATPAAGQEREGLRQEEQPASAPPKINVDGPSAGVSLIINGDHAEPHVHVTGRPPEEEYEEQLRRLAEEFFVKLQSSSASGRTVARARSAGNPPGTRRIGRSIPAALGLVVGLVPILAHSAIVVQVIAITALAALPVFGLVVIATAIFSRRSERRDAAFSVLRLLRDWDLCREHPPGRDRQNQSAFDSNNRQIASATRRSRESSNKI